MSKNTDDGLTHTATVGVNGLKPSLQFARMA